MIVSKNVMLKGHFMNVNHLKGFQLNKFEAITGKQSQCYNWLTKSSPSNSNHVSCFGSNAEDTEWEDTINCL